MQGPQPQQAIGDPKIFFKADKKRKHLALRVRNSIEWKDDELFVMTIVRPVFRTPGDAKPIRVEWGPGLDIASLRNTDQYNTTAMKYACRVHKVARWFEHSLNRHEAMPKEAFIRAYNIRVHPRSVRRRGDDRCGCCRGPNTSKADGVVHLGCWMIEGQQARCAACSYKGRTDCSFQTRAYSRAAVYTSGAGFKAFDDSSKTLIGAVEMLLNVTPNNRIRRETRQALDQYKTMGRPRLGDLSAPVMDEANDVPDLDNEDSSDDET